MSRPAPSWRLEMVERQKVCSLCGATKPWSEYHASRRWEDGTMRSPYARCKPCHRKTVRQDANTPHGRARNVVNNKRMRERNMRDPVRAELQRAYWRDYQAKRRRAEGKVERPQCSPYGRTPTSREWLPADPFIAWMAWVVERDETSLNELAALWGISDKTLREIAKGRRQPSIETVERALLHDGYVTFDELYADHALEAA